MPNASPAQIKGSVCRFFGISENQLQEKNNRPEIAFPRQFAAYLLRKDGTRSLRFPENGRLSLPCIGKLLVPSGEMPQHHTTILHGICKIERMLEDPKSGHEVAAAIEHIRSGYKTPPTENAGAHAAKHGLQLIRSRK